MKSSQIKSRKYNEKKFKSLLLAFIKQKPNGFRLSEAVVATGLSNDWVEFALRSLLKEYKGRISLTEEHHLYYNFELEKESSNLLLKLGWRVLQGLWLIFVLIFKVWTALMLCTYFIVSLIVAVSIILGSSNVTDIDKPKENLQVLNFEGIDHFFIYGPVHPKILKSIFAYLFGNPKTKRDENTLATEKLILQQIRANKGYLFTSDIIRLTACDLTEAQIQAAQILANYKGEVNVNEQGIIEYYFPEFNYESNEEVPIPIWERLIPARKLNDNPDDMNNAIAHMNTVNLFTYSILLVIVLLFSLIGQDIIHEIGPFPVLYVHLKISFFHPIPFFIFWFPIIFSLIFRLIPWLRSLVINFKNKRIKTFNKDCQILEVLFQQIDNPKSLNELVEQCQVFYDESREKVVERIAKIALSIGGSLELNETGESYWQFEDITIEREMIKKLHNA